VTAYEYLDLALGNYENSTALITFGFTILGAYLLAVYIIGPKLTTPQVAALTFIYTLGFFFNSAAQLSFIFEAMEFRSMADALLPEQSIRHFPLAPYFVIFIRLSIYVVSVWFMWDIRHPKGE
jgi:hypothetical protein